MKAIPFKDLYVGAVFTCFPEYDNEWHQKVEGGTVRVNPDGTPHPNAEAFVKHGPVPVDDPELPCYLGEPIWCPECGTKKIGSNIDEIGRCRVCLARRSSE